MKYIVVHLPVCKSPKLCPISWAITLPVISLLVVDWKKNSISNSYHMVQRSFKTDIRKEDVIIVHSYYYCVHYIKI